MIRALLLATLLASSGCATAGGSGPFDGGREDSITLHVRNLNFADARLYTIRRSAARQLLGSVGGKQERDFTVDWQISEPLRIEIDLLAGPTCTTEELYVDPGDMLELQIEAVFGRSSFCR